MVFEDGGDGEKVDGEGDEGDGEKVEGEVIMKKFKKKKKFKFDYFKWVFVVVFRENKMMIISFGGDDEVMDGNLGELFEDVFFKKLVLMSRSLIMLDGSLGFIRKRTVILMIDIVKEVYDNGGGE